MWCMEDLAHTMHTGNISTSHTRPLSLVHFLFNHTHDTPSTHVSHITANNITSPSTFIELQTCSQKTIVKNQWPTFDGFFNPRLIIPLGPATSMAQETCHQHAMYSHNITVACKLYRNKMSLCTTGLTACFLENSSRSMMPQYLRDSDSGSFFDLLLLCCTVSSSRSFLGRFTVLLSRRVAIDDGVDMTTDDDDGVRYDVVTGVAVISGELTGVVVSAFLFTPFFVYTRQSPHNL